MVLFRRDFSEGHPHGFKYRLLPMYISNFPSLESDIQPIFILKALADADTGTKILHYGYPS